MHAEARRQLLVAGARSATVSLNASITIQSS